MKRHTLKPSVFSVILFSLVFTADCQTSNTLNDVAGISAYSNVSADALFVKDPVRGGHFSLYTGLDAEDNGMIFKDTRNRKWLRQTSGKEINIVWYGASSAQSLNDKQKDIYPYLVKAMNYVWSHPGFSTVRIPHDRNTIATFGYLCLSTVTINRPLNIVGDGVNTVPLTKINFPANVKGFITAFETPEGNRNAVRFEYLWLSGSVNPRNAANDKMVPEDGLDLSAHMIIPKGFIEVSKCIISNTAGDGVHLETCVEKKSPIYGNVDGSIIEDTEFAYCRNGIYLDGCDANIVRMKRNNYTNMRRWGQYNNGFLGSQETDSHYSINGYNNNCFANYKGKTWYAINTDYKENIGKQPDKNPDYWEVYPTQDPTFDTWSAVKRYWSGGPYMASNDNGFSKYDYNYTEANQPPARVNNKTIVLGGDNGAEVRGGVFLEANGGLLAIKNSGLWLADNNFSIGTPYANAKLRINQKTTGEPGIWISSTTNQASTLRFGNNTSEQVGEIYYNTNDFEFITQNTPRAILNAGGFKPYTGSSYDLGSPTLKWRTIYADKFYGDGSALTGISQGLWKTGANGSIFSNASGNVGINQENPAAQLHIVNTARNKPGIIVTGGSIEGWNGNSGQIQIGGLPAGNLKIGYEANDGVTYFDNTYNNADAKQFFRLRTSGAAVTPLTLTGANAAGINNTNPHASAVLDVSSTTKGLLPPRMSSADKKAIKNPAEGLIVYDLTLHKLCVFTGAKWETITSL